MEQVLALLELFADKYIYCQKEEAIFNASSDAERERMTDSFLAITDYAQLLANEENKNR